MKTKMIFVIIFAWLTIDQATAEVVQPLQVVSIPDADFAPSREFNGIRSLLQ